jgi:hypothetical protein
MNRISRSIDELRPLIETLPKNKVESLNDSTTINFEEHFKFQELQSHAHAMDILKTDEATVIFRALGPVYGAENNGGWAKDTDLATKVVVIKIMEELLRKRISS